MRSFIAAKRTARLLNLLDCVSQKRHRPVKVMKLEPFGSRDQIILSQRSAARSLPLAKSRCTQSDRSPAQHQTRNGEPLDTDRKTSGIPLSFQSRAKTRSGRMRRIATGSISPAAWASMTAKLSQWRRPERIIRSNCPLTSKRSNLPRVAISWLLRRRRRLASSPSLMPPT